MPCWASWGGGGEGLPEATPPPRLTPPRSPRARRPTYRSRPPRKSRINSSSKKIAPKTRITIHDHPYLKTSHSRKNRARSRDIFILSPRMPAVASKPGSIWLSGAPIDHNAVSRSHALPWGLVLGRGRRADHASLCVQRSPFGLCHRLRRLLERVLEPVGTARAPAWLEAAPGAL